MPVELDHLVLTVVDVARSVDFYDAILGLRREADDGPFSVVRVTPGFVILLARGETAGGEHLAFSMPKAEFDLAFERVVEAGLPYGDRFDTVGSMHGPSDERGARGDGKSLYFFDPDRHLIEIRYYECT